MESLIKKILQFSPRDFKGEIKTKNFLKVFFGSLGLNYFEQEFKVHKPSFKTFLLKADDKRIACLPCCFVSGKIENKKYLSNVLVDFQTGWEKKSINFNPLCQSFSLACFYFSPALAIRTKDVNKLLKAKKVFGFVKVKKEPHNSANLIVGNIKNPKNIIFTHYDSIFEGAVDNASGVAVLLEILRKKRETTKKNLFIFSGSEELSYDRPVYWGFGYRKFEENYFGLLKKVKKVIVIDSVGCGKTQMTQANDLLFSALPLKNLKRFSQKTFLICGEMDKLMEVYHSPLDKAVEKKGISSSLEMLLKLIL